MDYCCGQVLAPHSAWFTPRCLDAISRYTPREVIPTFAVAHGVANGDLSKRWIASTAPYDAALRSGDL